MNTYLSYLLQIISIQTPPQPTKSIELIRFPYLMDSIITISYRNRPDIVKHIDNKYIDKPNKYDNLKIFVTTKDGNKYSSQHNKCVGENFSRSYLSQYLCNEKLIKNRIKTKRKNIILVDIKNIQHLEMFFYYKNKIVKYVNKKYITTIPIYNMPELISIRSYRKNNLVLDSSRCPKNSKINKNKITIIESCTDEEGKYQKVFRNLIKIAEIRNEQ